MFDAVFAATVAARGVTPVMFGDEFLVRSVLGGLWFTARSHRQRFPAPTATPLIFGEEAAVLVLKHVTHWQRQVRLAVKRPRDQSDCATRNQLADKDDTASPFVRAFSADIKAQVHFLEIAMKRNRQTDHACVEKQKSDDAQKSLPVVEIQLSVHRHE